MESSPSTALGSNPNRRFPITLPPRNTGAPVALVAILTLLALGTLVALPMVIPFDTGLRVLLAVCFFLVLFACRNSPAVAYGCLVYLVFIGGFRRNIIPFLGEPTLDPLQIVVPLITVLYALLKLVSRQIKLDTGVAKLRFWLLVFMLVEIVNPKQGPLLVGVAGAMFYVVPVLWSLFGRDLGKPNAMRLFFGLIVILGLITALYGIKQGIYGLTPAEKQWMEDTSGGSALTVGKGELRPFSLFSSSAEYAGFLTVAMILAWVWFLTGKRVALFALPVLGWAIFYTGVRGPIVLSLAGCVMVWAVQGRKIKHWIPRAALAMVLAAGGLVYGLTHAEDATSSTLVQHQAGGLLDPTNSKKSTLGNHAQLVENGVTSGFTNPIGMGLGSTTLAAQHFGGVGYSSEVDVSNMFISLGCVGGLLYIGFIVTTLLMAVRCWHYRRTFSSLGILAVLFGSLGSWLNGGSYSKAMLIWFCIGALEWEYQQLRLQELQSSPTTSSRGTGRGALPWRLREQREAKGSLSS